MRSYRQHVRDKGVVHNYRISITINFGDFSGALPSRMPALSASRTVASAWDHHDNES